MTSDPFTRDRALAEGELFLVGGGDEPNCGYVAGLYRARSGFSLRQAADDFLAGIPDGSRGYLAPGTPGVVHGVDTRGEIEKGFVAHLLARGLVEQVPVLNIDIHVNPGRQAPNGKHVDGRPGLGLWFEQPVPAPGEDADDGPAMR